MITYESAMQARETIIGFVAELHHFLGHMCNEPFDQDGNLLVLPEMQSQLKVAWADFDEDFSLDRARELIFKTEPETLQSHGLYGAQLGAKMTLFSRRLQGFLNNRKKRTLLWLIDAADTVLDSIISATGLDAALKELKDLLGSSVDKNE